MSKIIYLKRSYISPLEATAKDDQEAKAYFQEASVLLGPYWSGARYATGLTPDEEDILGPLIVGFKKSERDYQEKFNDYYRDINVQIPPNYGTETDGLALEIDLKSQDRPLSVENLPIDLIQYVIYKHAIKSPQVGRTKEDADNSPQKFFYIYSPSVETKVVNSDRELSDIAMEKYLVVKGDNKLVEKILILLNVNLKSIKGDDQVGQKVTKLRQFIDTKPQAFLDLVNDKNMEDRYFITQLLNYSILEKIGNRYYEIETNAELADGEIDLISYLKDQKNSKDKVKYAALLQTALKVK